MKKQLRALHDAMLELTGMINEPKRDDVLLAEAGLTLDRALFPLLVRIGRKGPIGIVQLAGLAGRDHSTVSRQVAKLEKRGLVARRDGTGDKRVQELTVTPKGQKMCDALDRARERLFTPRLAGWSTQELDELVRLLRKMIDSGRT